MSFLLGFFVGVFILGLHIGIKRQLIKVNVGDVFTYTSDSKDPFNRRNIVITDIKEGWVQYQYTPVTEYSGKYSTRISTIKSFYTKVS